MLEIRDSVAVITGGGGGIGLEVAKYWVRNGGKVVIADVASNLLEQAAEELKALQGEVLTVVCNVTREEDCGSCCPRTRRPEKSFGKCLWISSKPSLIST
jgi:3-oxoacyl-[acyl-carrier protein] reductase